MRAFLIFLLVLVLSASAIAMFAWKDYTSPSGFEHDTTVILPRGSGFTGSVDILAEKGIIEYPLFFKIFAYINGDAKRVKAGEYIFPAYSSPQSILQLLVEGKVVVHKITIAEGLNIRQVIKLLRDENLLEGDIPEGITEGSLFPETYHYILGDSRASIVFRMQEKMQKTLDELWEKRSEGLPLKTKEEALILASIVEKETGVPAERAHVASVFINRLRIGMRLQSDPTVVYGIEIESGKPMERQLTSADLKAATAYNTYVIEALPPTPIANPSREAIEATLHPIETKDLFFVATGNGGHNFSSTLAEHNKNVQEYRKNIAK